MASLAANCEFSLGFLWGLTRALLTAGVGNKGGCFVLNNKKQKGLRDLTKLTDQCSLDLREISLGQTNARAD